MSVPVWRREWRWQCQGRGCFRWREDIILRLTEKFGVVREGEMTRRESGPMQLDEREEGASSACCCRLRVSRFYWS